MPPSISRTPDFWNQFSFPLEVREIRILLYFKNPGICFSEPLKTIQEKHDKAVSKCVDKPIIYINLNPKHVVELCKIILYLRFKLVMSSLVVAN